MSNHFSAAGLKHPGDDARLDLTDLFVFAAPGHPGRTVLIMNSNPFTTPKASGDAAARAGIGNIVGDSPFVEMAKALVAGGNEGLHVSIGRERPGRYSFGLRVIAGDGIVVHAHPLAGEW
jgi:Domain of unknown function (DUF4331)